MDICSQCNKTHAFVEKCIFCGVIYCKYCIKHEQPSIPSPSSFFLSKYFPPIKICAKCYVDESKSLRNRHHINNIVKRDQIGWIEFWRGRWPYHFLFCGELWGIWTLHELWIQLFNGQLTISLEMDNISVRDQLKQPRTMAISMYSDLHIDAPPTGSILKKYVQCTDLSDLILSYLVGCDRCRSSYVTADPKRMDYRYFEVKKPTEYIQAPDIGDILCESCFQRIELCEFCARRHMKGHMKRCWNEGCGIRTCQECTQSFQHLSHEENCLVLSRYVDVMDLMQRQSWMSMDTAMASCRGYYQLRFAKNSKPQVYELTAMSFQAT